MPREIDAEGRTYIRHLNGQLTHYIRDSFVDPWKQHETVLIQHGFGRHAEFWYHWIPILSRKYHVIRRVLRGHGHSTYPSQEDAYEYDVDTIIGEIVDTLDQLGVKKCHFLGESTGGMLGEIMAVKHQNRLLSLTICSTPTHLPPVALKLFAFGHRDWPSACRALGSRGWAEALSKTPGTTPTNDASYQDWYLEQISVSSGEGLAQYAEFLSTLDVRPYLKWIDLPVLILAPNSSAATSVDEQRKVADEIKGSRIEVIEGLGHEIYVTEGEKCQTVFLDFLASLSK